MRGSYTESELVDPVGNALAAWRSCAMVQSAA